MPRSSIPMPRATAGTRTTVNQFPGLDSCVGWWRCRQADVGTTTLTNEIVGGANFTLVAPVWTTYGGRNCLVFPGAANPSTYGTLTINASDLLDVSAATSLTVLFLVRSRGSGGNGNGRVLEGGPTASIVRGNDVFFNLSTAAGGGLTTFSYSSISYATGFQVIAQIYNGAAGTRQLVVNNANVGTPVSSVSSSLNSSLTGTLNLARDAGGTSGFDGYIAEIAIFKNRILTPQQCYDFVFGRRPLERGTSRSTAT